MTEATPGQSEPKGNPKHRNLTNPCNGTNRQGEPCQLPAMKGGKVCRSHGGAAPQTKRKARERLEAAADRMARELLGMATDANVSESVRLAAIRDALSRAGITERTALEVTAVPFEQLYGDVMSGGSRADYRRSIGHPDPEPQSLAIAEHHAPTRPGGPRVLASHPDGTAFIIDGDTPSEPNPGGSDNRAGGDVDRQGEERLRQTLAKPALELPAAQSGYLDTETAMEVAANANRAYRSQLRRR